MNNGCVCQQIIGNIHVSQSTEELWETLLLEKFPNTPKHKIAESKWHAAMSWSFGNTTIMSELYDKYVMMKRLKGIEPGKDDE